MSSTGRLNVVQLGRYGDIFNIIPALQLKAHLGHEVHLYVAESFKNFGTLRDIFVHPLPLQHWEVLEACEIVKKLEGELLVAQVWGNHGTLVGGGVSFAESSFARLAPNLPWGEVYLSHSLQRDPGREGELIGCVDVPVETGIMVSLSGASAPLGSGHTVYNRIRRHFPHIVNLGALCAEKVQDLLGLYDKYKVLITIDTATLHLAKNHPTLKLVQLMPPASRGWLNCPRMPNAAMVVSYDEAASSDDWLVRVKELL